ncbi:MAG: HU family DNA-binding protein [Clostridia bacterium]|nr:HU family DNA-binding protein [Clostridia bacterium]
MNKMDLVGSVAEKANLTKKEADRVVSAVLESIEEALAAGDKVQLVGFGTFEVKDRAARTGRNPKTGEEIDIPATRVPVFKAGKALRDAVAK